MNFDELHDIIKRIDALLTDRQNKVSWMILLRANLRDLMHFIINAAFIE